MRYVIIFGIVKFIKHLNKSPEEKIKCHKTDKYKYLSTLYNKTKKMHKIKILFKTFYYFIATPTDPPPEEKLEWEVVRFDFVSMIFHDLILMFFIVTSSLVVVYVMKKQFVCCKKPGVVTSQAKSDAGVENVNYSSNA